MNADIIGNRYKLGPVRTSPSRKEIETCTPCNSPAAPGDPSLFLSGNIGYNQSNPNGDQYAMADRVPGEEQQAANGPIPAAWRRTSPMANTPRPIIAEPAANLEASVLPIVGASRRLDCDGNWVDVRDTQDQKIINQYNTGTGPNTIFRGEETQYGGGGYPTIAQGTACTDPDLDGMPNAWESARGLSNSNAADRNGDLDNDDYSNLEEYLAGPQEGGGVTPPPALSGIGVITEALAPSSSTGKVDVRGLSPRRPFGTGQ
jgi:hypothetical protein